MKVIFNESNAGARLWGEAKVNKEYGSSLLQCYEMIENAMIDHSLDPTPENEKKLIEAWRTVRRTYTFVTGEALCRD